MSVETSRHGRVLVIKMARTEKRNALNSEITAGIDAAMNELDLMNMEIMSVLKRDYKRIRVDDSDERKTWYPEEFNNDIQKLLLHKTNLWVITSTIQKNKGILVDVYTSAGNLIDNFYLPIGYSRPYGILFWSMTISDNDLFLFNENEDNTMSLVKYNIPVPLK